MAETVAETRPRVEPKVKAGKPPGGGRGWMALAFLLPALAILGAVVVYPTIQAIQNNAIWVATAPAIITGLGLMFAILTERVRYSTAIKIIVFMPMAISFLATGVIWRVMYDPEPEKGFVNATVGAVSDAVSGPGLYPTAAIPPGAELKKEGGAIVTQSSFEAGSSVQIGLT